MEKKLRYIILIFLVTTGVTYGQIHIKGQRYVDFAVGSLDGYKYTFKKKDNTGFWISVSTGKYDKNENALRFSADYRHKFYTTRALDDIIPVIQYSGTFGYQFKLYKTVNRNIYVNIVPAIGCAYESINHNINQVEGFVIKNNSKFLITANPALEMEIGSIVIQARQVYHPKSTIKDFSTQIRISYRLNR